MNTHRWPPPPRVNRIIQPPTVEPDSWTSVEGLYASAKAWYEAKVGKSASEIFTGYRDMVDAHLAIDRLPLRRRLWTKLAAECCSQSDYRYPVILCALIAVAALIVTFTVPKAVQSSLAVLGVAAVLLAAIFWRARRRYCRRTAFLKNQAAWHERKTVKPPPDDLVVAYLQDRLRVIDRTLPFVRLCDDLQAAAKRHENAAGVTGFLAVLNEWRVRAAKEMRTIETIMDCLAEQVEAFRDVVCSLPAPADGGDLDGPARLRLLLPQINEALHMIALADRAREAPSLEAILNSPAMSELLERLHYRAPTMPPPPPDVTT